MKKLFTLLFAVMGLTAFSQTVKHVNAEEFKKLIDEKVDVLILIPTDAQKAIA